MPIVGAPVACARTRDHPRDPARPARRRHARGANRARALSSLSRWLTEGYVRAARRGGERDLRRHPARALHDPRRLDRHPRRDRRRGARTRERLPESRNAARHERSSRRFDARARALRATRLIRVVDQSQPNRPPRCFHPFARGRARGTRTGRRVVGPEQEPAQTGATCAERGEGGTRCLLARHAPASAPRPTTTPPWLPSSAVRHGPWRAPRGLIHAVPSRSAARVAALLDAAPERHAREKCAREDAREARERGA